MTTEVAAAARAYAEDFHWDVVPGTWLTGERAAPRCSCGASPCADPGGHPARRDWRTAATSNGRTVRDLWDKEPQAAVLLPTGRSFDVIDVPESAGELALAHLERMDVHVGPVAATPARRMLFFVLPGGAAKTPDLLRRQGYAPQSLDLVVRGEGGYVPAPPTPLTGGSVTWARKPTVAYGWLPDVEDLISPLAYACGRER